MVNRKLNIECFRLIATIFVIILHVLGQGGILDSAIQGGSVYWAAWFLEICAFCSVNCFALITGYVMVDKKISSKTIMSLWLRVAFYSLVISGVVFALFPESISLKRIVVAFLPITGQQWWYISSYFWLFFSIPFLNAGINSISIRYYRTLLITILLGVCVISCILPIDAFTLNNGYSAVWLDIVYLFGAYIKKNELEKKITASKSFLGFIAVVVITFLSKFIIYHITKKIFGTALYDNKLISYTSITILLASIYLFLFFLNTEIKCSNSVSKLLEFFFISSLDTYLIHTHPLVFDFIVKDSFVVLSSKQPIIMVSGVIIISFVILIICSMIDAIRRWFFKIIKIERISAVIDKKINKIYFNIFKVN